MTDSIGKALASAIKEPVAAGSEKRGGHIFQNRHRRDIFSVLTLMPCIGVSRISAECGISQNTVKWHLDRLVDSGYLVKHGSGKSSVFFPEGLITHDQAMIFRSINHPGIGPVFRLVLKNPGMSQTEMTAATGMKRQTLARSLAELESAGLTTMVADGTHTRFYPTKLLEKSADDFYTQSRKFSDFIMRKLESEMGKPTIIVKKGLDRIVVEMGAAAERFAMELGINPFLTCGIC
jgi:predicted transcriptional regulator